MNRTLGWGAGTTIIRRTGQFHPKSSPDSPLEKNGDERKEAEREGGEWREEEEGRIYNVIYALLPIAVHAPCCQLSHCLAPCCQLCHYCTSFPIVVVDLYWLLGLFDPLPPLPTSPPPLGRSGQLIIRQLTMCNFCKVWRRRYVYSLGRRRGWGALLTLATWRHEDRAFWWCSSETCRNDPASELRHIISKIYIYIYSIYKDCDNNLIDFLVKNLTFDSSKNLLPIVNIK